MLTKHITVARKERPPGGLLLNRLLRVAAFAGFCGVTACGIAAETWSPAHAIELIAPSGAGGGSDHVARAVQKVLQESKLVDVPVTIVNRPGAGGALAWSGLNQGSADGSRIAISTANLLTNAILGKSTLRFTDLTPVAQLFSEYPGVAVRNDSPIKNGKDLLAQLKQDPSALPVAIGTTIGSVGHIALALSTKAVGRDAKLLKTVVFPSASQGMAALMGGHVAIVTSPVSNLISHALDGRIRIIAIAAPKRFTGKAADIPTLIEFGVPVVVDSLRGVVGPKAMSAPQIAYWEGALKKMSESDSWRTQLERNLWVNSFADSKGSAAALKAQQDEMRVGLTELGLAKN